ncbi:hypothetical protein SLEP1_g57514 [Rubroshorea leprosula]|uniref:Uncharacterized protein n=1 Tax=Rubroshorea leprosula TaxID=152421 RepID=A0AAV5MQG8_9ROSI|nr:hypothetical protein SLEP1_g57514 [Rubroshorea leprosula]
MSLFTMLFYRNISMRQYLVFYAKDLETSLALVRASKLSSKGIIKTMMMISMMKMDPIIKM